MGSPLRVLLLEDSPGDARLIIVELEESGFTPTAERVDTRDGFRAALDEHPWDIVIADYSIPQFGGLEALDMMRERDLDIPLIIASGVIGEDSAVATIKRGAYDYVMKDRLARLGPAVRRALQEAGLDPWIDGLGEPRIFDDPHRLARERWEVFSLAGRLHATVDHRVDQRVRVRAFDALRIDGGVQPEP